MTTPQAMTVPAPGLWDQFHRMIRWGKTLLYVSFGLLAFILLAEASRVHALAAAIHPWMGHVSLVAMGVGLALVGYPAVQFLKMPRVVDPPPVPEREQVGLRHLRAEHRYLDRYLLNCDRNPEFSSRHEGILRARAELAELGKRLASATENNAAEMDRELCAWTRTRMSAVLAETDERADRMIYQEALAVGLATAASPNGTLDAFVMLWRSVRLVSQLSVLYYGRPGVWGTLLVCRDVSVATALAGFLQNVTDSLGGLLAKSLGGATGVVAGPAVDGVTNALVLIRIGYLAKERCRSFRHWDAQTRKSALGSALNATQKVAVGLTMEILRQVGGKLGMVAGMVASGVGSAAGKLGTATESIRQAAANAAGSVAQSAADLRQSIEERLGRKRNEQDDLDTTW